MSDEVTLRLAQIRGRLEADPGTTFTRLSAEGGALHMGGGDGIVYAANHLGYVEAPEALDGAFTLMHHAHDDLNWALGQIERLREVLRGLLQACCDDTLDRPETWIEAERIIQF